jgi:phage tail-like protein
MNPPELRRQVFRTAPQWERGLSYRLATMGGGGLALLSRPAFAGWVTQTDAARDAGSMTGDECGRVYWIHRDDCRLYRLDPANGLVEAMVPLAECGGGRTARFGRLIHGAGRLWLLDLSGARLIALRPDTFQIIAEVRLRGPVDFAAGGGRLVAIDAEQVRTFDLTGRDLDSTARDHMVRPVALGLDPTGKTTYVLDAGKRRFLRLDERGSFRDEIGELEDAGAGFAPHLLAVHPDGNLFVSDGTAAVHEFAPDGSYVGSVEGVRALSKVLGLAFDAGGQLYVGSPSGIARFGSEGALVGNPGRFYSATLDNGTLSDESWHRLDLTADLDAGGAIDVWYASSQDAALVAAVDGALQRERTAAERAADLEALLGDQWDGPHRLRAPEPASGVSARDPGSGLGSSTSHSVLFKSDTKRYLWLKLELSGLTPRAAAAVREMRVYYPRLSYLRYLPATYQENGPSREFLERFLSLFETVFGDLEATIARIPEVFSPEVVPSAFLDWLAQWLDLGIEEDWDPAVKRRLIERAAALYERKGTPEGLADFIEVIVGQRPLIVEAFESERPLVLGEAGRLGRDTRLEARVWEAVPRSQRTVLDGGSALGSSRLRASARRQVNPYQAAAYRFTLVLRLSARQLRRHRRALDRIIREHVPAHVGYELLIQTGGKLGPSLVLGVNATVEDPQPAQVGYSALGRAVCARTIRYGPELDTDATLSDAADEWCRASACS